MNPTPDERASHDVIEWAEPRVEIISHISGSGLEENGRWSDSRQQVEGHVTRELSADSSDRQEVAEWAELFRHRPPTTVRSWVCPTSSSYQVNPSRSVGMDTNSVAIATNWPGQNRVRDDVTNDVSLVASSTSLAPYPFHRSMDNCVNNSASLAPDGQSYDDGGACAMYSSAAVDGSLADRRQMAFNLQDDMRTLHDVTSELWLNDRSEWP
jgi:hypothetical protein